MPIFKMKDLFLIFFASIIGVLQMSAQVLFANIHQVPLVLNASNVGSKYGHRLALAANDNSNNQYQNSNYAFSYDTFTKQKRLALGTYYWSTALAENLRMSDYTVYAKKFEHDLFNRSMPNKDLFKEGGVCLGVKYNVINKQNPNTFKASITPALGISIGGGHVDNYSGFDYVSSNNDYLDANDSMFYKHQITRSFSCAGQFGIKYNAERFLIMYQLKIRKVWISEKHITWSTSSLSTIYPEGTVKYEAEGGFTSNSIEQRIAATYLIRKKQNEKFCITLHGSIGLFSFMGIPKTKQNPFTESSALLNAQNNKPYRYLATCSAIAKVSKILVGWSWARYNLYSSYGMSAGLQFTHFKLLGTYFPTSENRKRPTTLEMVLMIHIPQ